MQNYFLIYIFIIVDSCKFHIKNIKMTALTILSVGKTKERWLEEACAEYLKRLQSTVKISCLWVKDDEQLVRAALGFQHRVPLDSGGMQYTSEEFSTFLMRQLENARGQLCFVIGGAEGLPATLKGGTSLSLSKMTLTHQMTRVILLEQVYRAFAIARGSPYHK